MSKVAPFTGGKPAPEEPAPGDAVRPRRVGLALGSGSARGWAHIGVIEALAAQGIHPHVVCGSSIGSLVAGAYVAGKLDALDAWACRVNWREMARLADLKLSGGGLIEGDRLVRFLRDLFGDVKIEDLDIPFAAVAADLGTGEEVWFREGSLVDAVRASMALPGLLSPVRLHEWQLADGGLVNPVPVGPCRELGAEAVIAVNLNGDLVGRRVQGKKRRRKPRRPRVRSNSRSQFLDRLTRDIPNGLRLGVGMIGSQLLATEAEGPGYFDVVFGAINVMQDRITRDRLAGDAPEVLIEPRLRHISLLEFNRAEEAIEEGRAAVEQALPAIEKTLGLPRRRRHG